MKLLRFSMLLPGVCLLSVASAQVKDTTINVSRDYLEYGYRNYEGEALRPGKFFTVISSRPAKIIIPEKSRGEKRYRITKEGVYQYSYTGETGDSDAAFRPMSPRTFYLETSRQGILPPGISYADFLAMTLAEKQAALGDGRGNGYRKVYGKLYEATVKYAATDEGLKVLVSRGTWKAELQPIDREAADPDILFVSLLPHKTQVPRVIRNFLTPVDKAKISSLDEYDELLEFMDRAGEVIDGR